VTGTVNAYCTVDDLRAQLGESKPGNLPEAQLVRAVNAASRAVDNYTGRRFWQDETPQSVLVAPSIVDPYTLWLPGNAEISTVTGLNVATDNGTGTYGTSLVQDTDYRLWPYAANTGGSEYGGWWMLEGMGTSRFDVRGARGSYPVRITARFGWAFVPVEVEQATLLKAAALFKRKDAPFGVLQFGDIAAVRVTRQDIDVIELLSGYVRDVAMVG
jgi:hypothetical protein